MPLPTFEGFLLTRNWRDSPRGIELEFWFVTDEGPICALVQEQRSLFFLSEREVKSAKDLLRAERGLEFKPVALRDFAMTGVEAVYFRSHRQLRRAAVCVIACSPVVHHLDRQSHAAEAVDAVGAEFARDQSLAHQVVKMG